MVLKLFLIASTLAMTSLGQPVMAASTEPSFAAAGLRMFWGLLLVLAVILIIYGLARKRLSLLHANNTSKIKILEIRHLMPKKSLCLVEIAGREYLLGLGSETITLLAETEDKTKQCFSNTLETAKENHEHPPL